MPECKPNPAGPNLFILGEYHRGGALGRYISVYYGSFARVYGWANQETIQGHLRDVLLHEFTHHLQSLAGERGLEVQDQEFIQAHLRKYKP